MTNAELMLIIKARDEASSVLKNVQTNAGGMSGALGDAAKIASGFVIGQGIMSAPGFLMSAAKAAADDAASTAKLQQAVINSGAAYDQYAGQLKGVIDHGMKLGFTDDQTRDALALLVAQTGDAGEAMKRYAMAQDLARGANIDVVTASKLLGKVTDENVNVLGRYGITVEKGASETELFGAIQQKFGGQADAYANSTAGQMAAAQIQIHEMKESLGAVLLPVLASVTDFLTTKMFPAMDKTIGYISNHPEVEAGIAAFAAVVAAALVPSLVAWAAAQWAVLVPLLITALPIIAVAAAVALVVAGIVLLIQHWDQVRDAVMAAINYLGDLIEQHKVLAVVIAFLTGPIGLVVLAVVELIRNWDWVKEKAFEVFDFVKGAVNDVETAFWDAVHAVEALIDRITSIPSPGDIIGGIGHALHIPGSNAAGTSNWRGGPTWVGERGPEIAWLPRGTAITPNDQLGRAGPSNVYHVYINEWHQDGTPQAGLAALGITV